jgi:hypothetical protein
LVFATSENTISTTAYQPLYPNDRIQYDVSFGQTEITSGNAYGRITERIDEFNTPASVSMTNQGGRTFQILDQEEPDLAMLQQPEVI